MGYLPNKPNFRSFYDEISDPVDDYNPPLGYEPTNPNTPTNWDQWGRIGSDLINNLWGGNNQSGNAYVSGSSTTSTPKDDSALIWIILLIIGFVIALILLQG